MKSLSQVYSSLRKKNIRQYILLAGCCFFSVLLITAYVSMMRSPSVLNVLPEGGDSRKQVMMIFVLAVIGCGVFTTYASGLFFRYKSRETGIFLALGASKKQIKSQMTKELMVISFGSCALGALLGTPLAWSIWQIFRLFIVDTQEMLLTFDPHAYLYALAFSAYVIAMLFFMLSRFIRRTNIIDVVNESRKSEPIKEVPRWYGPVGIALVIAGGFLGYMTPAFFVRVLHWYAPEGLSSITYLPALIGLYMILLHTVVNGGRHGKNRYKNIISTSMMKFQGRQTVRNMLVITVLVAGAYFATFYSPMLSTGAMLGYDARPVDYAFHYREDQDMLTEDDILDIAQAEGVSITSYISTQMAVLGIDGYEQIESKGSLGSTYTVEYVERLTSGTFLSESVFNTLTGVSIDVAPGTIKTILNDDGSGASLTSTEINVVTNMVTDQVLNVTPSDDYIHYSLLYGYHVLDDGDYAAITQGLDEYWLLQQVFFNVENDAETYDFAKHLLYAIIDHSNTDVAVDSFWDPVTKIRYNENGSDYWNDRDVLKANGEEYIDYDQRDSASFRMYWKYIPKFRVLDKANFVMNTAVFMMLFVFIAVVCFAAVIVIAYTRSLKIGLTNAQVYDDLRHLGATNGYMLKTVKNQISKVYFTPVLTGTVIIFVFYTMIMFFNDGGNLTSSELAGLGSCLLLVAAVSAVLYIVYRITLRKVCKMLNVKIARG